MARLPDPEALRLVVLVAELGSVSAAAAQLGITQPAASAQLRTVERRLGLRLFDRTTAGSTATVAGKLVVGWARRVLAEFDTLLDGVAALKERGGDQLSVAASMTVAEHLLPGWLGELRRHVPGQRVGLQVTNSAQVCLLARQDAVRVGFIESPATLRGLRTRTVARDRLVLVVAPDQPWARRARPVGADELARTPLVSREQGSGTRETAEAAARRAGSALAAPALELGSGAAVRSTVLDGGGAALLSELVVGADLRSGALVEVATTGIDLRRELRAVSTSGRRLDGPAAALVRIAQRRGRTPATGEGSGGARPDR